MSLREHVRSAKKFISAATLLAALAAFFLAAPAAWADDDFTVSPGNSPDTVHEPYSPPAPRPEPEMRAPDSRDGASEDRSEETHDEPNAETEGRSRGEGSGQNEESPEPPSGE